MGKRILIKWYLDFLSIKGSFLLFFKISEWQVRPSLHILAFQKRAPLFCSTMLGKITLFHVAWEMIHCVASCCREKVKLFCCTMLGKITLFHVAWEMIHCVVSCCREKATLFCHILQGKGYNVSPMQNNARFSKTFHCFIAHHKGKSSIVFMILLHVAS